jgi:tetratricopeptide (TPR) repeat protein
MSQAVTPNITVPPENRRVATERFDRANQVISTGNYDYGVQLLLTCCKLDPANMNYRQTLRRTQKAKFNNNLRGSRFAFLTTIGSRASLKAARRSGNYLKVLECGELILSRNPWDLSAQLDMAAAADALGLQDMAIFILDQARQKYPRDATVNRALARLFEKRGMFTHAIALWQLVKEVAPKDVEAAHKAKDLAASDTIARGGYQESANSGGTGTAERLALRKQGEGKKDDPQDKLNRDTAPILARLESNPTEAQLYLQLATIYRRANQIERARAALEQGLGPTGNHFALQIELMELDLQAFRNNLRATEEKIAALIKVDEDERDGTTYDNLLRAKAQLVREITNREIDLFRMRADRFPQDLSHRLELGIRLYKADQVEQAIMELQQAKKDPKLGGKTMAYLGFCFKKRNNWRLAQRNLEESLQFVGDDSLKKEILYTLAKGHAEVEEFPRAIDLAHELANLDYGFRDIGKLLEEWERRLQ